ncbi:MAG: helix-hairpin-helix domain-containing protein [Cyclobacteriaceae bacterium]|nr:helix-hairpin-helix domain-containing protein [Cyclobacteriaceae bacterium]
MKKCAAILLLLVAGVPSLAQEYPRKEIDLERLADELFGFQDLDLNYEDLYENLALLLANPLNLNTIGAEELRFLNILTEEQVQNILKYRTEHGAFISVYELQAIPGFDLQTINRVVHFFTVDDLTQKLSGSAIRRAIEDGSHYVLLRYENTLETKRGFTDRVSPEQQFKGDEHKLYMRFRSSRPGDYSFGFTAEKDAGETLQWSPSTKYYGADFTSIHAQVLNKGKIKNLILGDYQAQFGQGLILGGNFGFGKGAETITTIRRSNLGFTPYTSINETGYLRGAGLTYEILPNVNISGFYSRAYRDASVNADTTDLSFASAFQTTGFHRNTTELNRRKALGESQQGVVLHYKKSFFDVGLIYHRLAYDMPVNRTPQPYNQFVFSGDRLVNTGAYMNYSRYNFTFFAEAAKTIDGGAGITGGLLGSLTPQFDVALHYRNYQRNFQSLYSNAFAESSVPRNERGMYWGWRYRWSRKYSLAGYMDFFRFPWLQYRNYRPSEGHEFLVRFNYQPSRNILLFVQAREESKSRNLSANESNLYLSENGIKRNYWIACDYSANRILRLKTRAQFSSYSHGGVTTQGMVLLQDVSLNINKLSFTARYALFDTDDYDNRQYIFERDVWLAFSMPALSGTGIRNYVLVQYDVNKKLTCWVRYAHIRYTDREEIGNGVDTIESDMRNDIKLQLRYRI